jgi:hypothetical protein
MITEIISFGQPELHLYTSVKIKPKHYQNVADPSNALHVPNSLQSRFQPLPEAGAQRTL